MKLRHKTRKRLAILLAIGLILGAVGGGAYAWRLSQIRHRVAEDRRLGLEYLDAGDDYNAMHHLGRYLRRETDDIDLLYQYAKVRMRVRETRGAHLGQALTVLRRVVEAQPDNLDAAHDLLDLYMQMGLASESLDLSERLLERNPADIAALAAKANALFHTRKFDEAFAVAEKCLALDPLNMDIQLVRLSVLQSRGTAAQVILDEAIKVAAAHEADPRGELLVALAAQHAQDSDTAKAWATRAITRTPTDAAFVARAVRILDQIGMPTKATQYLDEHARLAQNDYQLQRIYVRRLWQNNMTQRIVDHGRTLDIDDRSTDGDVLGVYTVALMRTDKQADAEKVIEAVRERTWDDASQAWVGVMDCMLAPEGESTPSALVDACRQALSYQPDQQMFYHFLAEAYQSMGETELALDAWRQTVAASPTWLEPRLRIAQVLLDTNRAAQAFAVAQEALAVAPTSISAAILLADAWDATAQQRQLLTGSSLLKLISLVQEAHPGEPRTLCVQASMYAQQGNIDGAKQCLQNMLDANEVLDQRLLMRGVEISRTHNLGMSDPLFQRERALRGLNATVGLARALDTLESDGPDAALKAFDAAAKPDSLEWRIARARLLTTLDSPQALEAWVKLADSVPDNAKVQQMALSTRVAWNDPALIDRATERLKTLTGEDGVRWRIARARQLLGEGSGRSEAIEAARLLADVTRRSTGLVECHLLLAEAYRRLDNQASTTEHLTTATNLRPEAIAPRLLLAKMLQSQGAEGEAMRQIDAVLASTIATDAQRITAIQLLAAQGEHQRALALLQSHYDGDPLPPDLLAARIFRQQGQLDQAEAVARKLLGNNDQHVIAFAADLLASRGKTDEATAVLNRLDQANITAAQRALVRTDHLARHGSADEAIAAARQATVADPTDATGWEALAKLLIAAGRADELSRVIAAAHEQAIDDPAMVMLHEHRDMIVELADTNGARALLLSLFSQGKHRDAAMAALKLMQKASNEKATLTSATAQFRSLADRNPELLPLQNLVAQMYAQLGQLDEVVAVASRAMQGHPTDVESASLAARALAGMKRWSEALSTARDWQQRAGGELREADQLIAACLLELGNPEAALRELQIEGNISAGDAALPSYIRALVDSGRAAEARQLIVPLLKDSPRTRSLAMEVASQHIDDHAAAAVWLEDVGRNLAPDAMAQRVELARAWRTLGLRTNVPAHGERGYGILAELCKDKDVTADALIAYGIMCDERHNTVEAERVYRAALVAAPGHPVAQNNLAILLIEREGFGGEATKLARDNMQRFPQSATLHDTFGEIAVKLEQYEDAIAAMRRAVELEPNTPGWKVKLAWALARSGRTDEAWKTLRTVSPQTVTELSRQPTMGEHVKELMKLTAGQ